MYSWLYSSFVQSRSFSLHSYTLEFFIYFNTSHNKIFPRQEKKVNFPCIYFLTQAAPDKVILPQKIYFGNFI